MKCFPWFGFIFSKARDRVDGSIKTGDLQKSEGYLRCTRFPILSIKNCSINHAHIFVPLSTWCQRIITPFWMRSYLCRLTPFIFSIFERFHSISSALRIPVKATWIMGSHLILWFSSGSVNSRGNIMCVELGGVLKTLR